MVEVTTETLSVFYTGPTLLRKGNLYSYNRIFPPDFRLRNRDQQRHSHQYSDCGSCSSTIKTY